MPKESDLLFAKYTLDRDIPLNIWKNYLKKYNSQFGLILDKDGIWKLKCKYGLIEPYSLKKGFLCFYGKFPTPSKKTYFLKRFDSSIEVTQNGYDDCVIKFLEQKLVGLCILFGLKRRRKLSESNKEQLRQNLKKAREVRNEAK